MKRDGYGSLRKRSKKEKPRNRGFLVSAILPFGKPISAKSGRPSPRRATILRGKIGKESLKKCASDNAGAKRSLLHIQERAQPRRRLELRDGVELLEGRGEGVREAPERARRKLRQYRVEVELVDAPGEVLGRIELAFDERPVNHELRPLVRQLLRLPGLDLPLHRLEVPLHAVDPDREGVTQAEALGVFG